MHPNLVGRTQNRDRSREGQSQAYVIYEPNVRRTRVSGDPAQIDQAKNLRNIRANIGIGTVDLQALK